MVIVGTMDRPKNNDTAKEMGGLFERRSVALMSVQRV